MGQYIVDFYCHSLGLAVEIDGDTHGSDKAQSYDQKRDQWLEEQGLQVVRFTNCEVLNEIEGVMQALENIIEKRLAEEAPQPPLRRGS